MDLRLWTKKKYPQFWLKNISQQIDMGVMKKYFTGKTSLRKSNTVSFTLLNLQRKNPAKLIEIEELSYF